MSRRGELRVGHQIAQRRFSARTLAARDVGADTDDGPVRDLRRLLDRPVDELEGGRIRVDVVRDDLREDDGPVAQHLAALPVDDEIGNRQDAPVRSACTTVRGSPAGSV